MTASLIGNVLTVNTLGAGLPAKNRKTLNNSALAQKGDNMEEQTFGEELKALVIDWEEFEEVETMEEFLQTLN